MSPSGYPYDLALHRTKRREKRRLLPPPALPRILPHAFIALDLTAGLAWTHPAMSRQPRHGRPVRKTPPYPPNPNRKIYIIEIIPWKWYHFRMKQNFSASAKKQNDHASFPVILCL
jgi:hypothetical protein